MPAITLNATNAQASRVQEATDRYNAANGTSLTAKQWIYVVLREAVVAQLYAQMEAAAQAVQTTIANDMSGGT